MNSSPVYQQIGRRHASSSRSHGKSRPHVKASCRKLRKMLHEKGRFNKAQRGLFGAEYGRHCKEKIECSVCGYQSADLDNMFVCGDCLTQVYCSQECQQRDYQHYEKGKEEK